MWRLHYANPDQYNNIILCDKFIVNMKILKKTITNDFHFRMHFANRSTRATASNYTLDVVIYSD